MGGAIGMWEVLVPEIEFGAHVLEEPKEHVREASISEEADNQNETARVTMTTSSVRSRPISAEWRSWV